MALGSATMMKSRIPRGRHTRKINNLLILIACLIAGGVLSLHFGQDAYFDLLNYHLYNAWAWWHDRYRIDLFVPGIQSFFSPYLDLVYFFLATKILDYHPLVLGFLAGWPYGCYVFVTILLARKVAEILGVNEQGYLSYGTFLVVAIGLGVTGAAAWSLIGLTTNDLTVGTLTNLGFYFILSNVGSSREWVPERRGILLAGAWFGVAAGLKLTACVYAPGAALVIFMFAKTWRDRFVSAFLFSASWLAFFLLLYGPWAIHLYTLTGNPFFPMFNNIFHSSWSANSAALDTRFLPKTTLQALFYPFYWMASSQPITINDLSFQDPRMAFAYIAVVLIAGVFVIANIKKRTNSIPKLIWIMILYFVVSYAIWQTLFSILRYDVSLEAIGAILVAVAIFETAQLVPRKLRKSAFLAISAIIIGAATFLTRYPTWGRVPFARKVFVFSTPTLPQRALVILASQPTGYAAALMGSKEPSLHFLGLPGYLETWGYRGLMRHELGHKLMTRIRKHKSNEFVAYSLRGPPPVSRLDFMGIRMDLNQCRGFSSNLGSPLRICKAVYDPAIAGKSSVAGISYHLEAIPVHISRNARLNITLSRRCSSKEQWGSATLAWDVIGHRQKPYHLYVSSGNGSKTLVATGSSKGRTVATGWVHGADRFILENNSGKVLTSQEISYAACRRKSGNT